MSDSLKIVVPTDFSKASLAALDWVRKLGALGDKEVHCINVVQEPMMYMPVTAGAVSPAMPTSNELKKISEESLDTFVANNLGDLQPGITKKVVTGRPAEEIINYAKKIDAQMIVIGTRGQSGLAHLLLGSTAEGVVRYAECAVLTVRS